MGECSLVGAGGRHAASVDSGNQLVKSTDTARKNPLQRKQVRVQGFFSPTRVLTYNLRFLSMLLLQWSMRHLNPNPKT